MESVNCQSCQEILLASKTTSQQLVRCGGCGHTFLPVLTDEAAIEKTDRMAKWSFWLGISSIILSLFAGIPALILGIRSLRRMRFRVVKQREKFQAIVGTTLGVIFGVFGGTCLTFVGILAAILISSFEKSEDPARVAEIASEVVTFDNSIGVIPVSAISILNQKFLDFADAEKRSDSNVRFSIFEFHMQMNDSQIRSQLRDRFIGDQSKYRLLQNDKIEDWAVKEAELERSVFVAHEDAEDRILRYMLIQRVEMSWFAASVVYRERESGLTEKDVRKMFESFEPRILANGTKNEQQSTESEKSQPGTAAGD